MRRALIGIPSWRGVATSMLAAVVPAALVTPQAQAAEVTVWLTEDLPEARALDVADRKTGGTLHLDVTHLRYPPMPREPADDRAIDALRAAVDANLERWHEFDVEMKVARDLALNIDDVTLLGSPRDRDELIEVLLYQGAAVVRSFPPSGFATAEAAAPYRVELAGAALPRPWLDAYALLGDREPNSSDFVDGLAWADWSRFSEALAALESATLSWPEGVGQVWIDGTAVEEGTTATLRPGRHWVHVVRDGVVSGRAIVDLAPGDEQPLPTAISDDELEAARAKVLTGTARNLPEAVQAELDRLYAFHGGATFVGAMDDRRPSLAAYKGGKLLEATRVTVVLAGDVGGGIHATPLIEELDGDLPIGASASGSVSFELGVSYFATAIGADLALTPGRTIEYANLAEDDNIASSVHPRPWVGLGAYAMRPIGRNPTVLILGEVGWQAPAHLTYGGRAVVGIPIDDDETWVRLSLGASYGPDMLWDLDVDPQPMLTGFFRVGVGSRL